MSQVFIFGTDEAIESYDDFRLDEREFVFRHMPADGPRALIEGDCWIFVEWTPKDLSGLEMCHRLRADPRTSEAHITMVLDHDDPDDRRRAVRAGADDYMIAPATRQAILDRILAHQPTNGWHGGSEAIEIGQLRILPAAERASYGDTVLALSPNEFRLLRFIAENPNRVLSRQELISALGKGGDPKYLRTVDVWVKRLRAALRKAGAGQILRTVTNKGYVLDVL